MDATSLRANVIALNTQRLGVIEQLRGELDATAGRERSVEEDQKIERMNTEIDRISREVNDLVTLETQFREADQLREAQARAYGDPGTSNVAEQMDYLRSFVNNALDRRHGSIEVNLRGAQRERELLRSGASAEEIRALAWDTGSSASLVPTTLARTLYQYMEASNGIWRAPTTRITTSTGEAMQFPKLAAHAIGTQVIAQGTALAGTDPTFAKMTLDAYKYGELVVVSNEFLTDSAIDIAGFLGKDIGRALGRVIATDLVTGSGSGKPNGLMTALGGSGSIVTGGSLITPTVEKLIDLVYSVADEYRNSGSAGWLTKDSSAGTLRKLRDGAGGTVGAFLWSPSLTQGVAGGVPDRFLDFPVYTDSNVAAQGSAAKSFAFGDFSAYYIRTVGNVVIDSSTERYFDTDQVGFRGKWRVDGDLIDSTAMNVLYQVVA